jgi:hypothetical protein
VRNSALILVLLVGACESPQPSPAPPVEEPLPPLPVAKKKPTLKARRTKKPAPVAKPVAAPAPVVTAEPPPLIEADLPSAPAPLVAAEVESPDHGNGEDIARIIHRAKRAAVRDCYERELKKNPRLEGKVTIELDLAPPQRVEHVAVKDDLGSPELTSCVETAMKTVRFPPLDEEVSIQLPFVLTAS